MGEFIRKLIRWIIFIILVVLLILLIIKLANKNGTAKKTKKVLDKGVTEIKKSTKDVITIKEKDTNKKDTTKKEETTKEDNNVVTSTLEVNTPDTGSASYLYILGIAIMGTGTYYIFRNRELKD